MKQIDFNRLFMQDQYRPLVYKVRNGANGAHDIAFFNSYIHDATIFLDNITFKRAKIDIPLERICWELKDSEYPSTIWFELGKKKNLEAIEILQVTGPLAHLKPEEQKKAIESHILEDSIEKSIQMLIDSQKLTKEEEEIVKCIYQELLAETKEDSKTQEESSLSLTRKKK